MRTATFPVKSQVNRRRLSDGRWQSNGGDLHCLAGWSSASLTYTLIAFTLDWSQLVGGQIKSAVLQLRTTTDHAGFPATAGVVVPATLLTSGWTDNVAAENVWPVVSYPFPTHDASARYSVPMAAGAGALTQIPLTTIVDDWAPANVKRSNGKPGSNKPNYGVMLAVSGGSYSDQRRWQAGSDRNASPSLRPQLVVTYEEAGGPGTVNLTGPVSPVSQVEGEAFTGDYVPGRQQDRFSRLQLQYFYDKAGEGWTLVATIDRPATASEQELGQFSEPLPGSLKSGISYEWTARVLTSGGDWTPYPARAALRVSTNNPVLGTPFPANGTAYSTLIGVLFGAPYSDPDNNALSSFRIQARSRTIPTDPNWDAGQLSWDTSDRAPTQAMVQSKRIGVLYEGDGLPAGNYSFRVKATDSLGAESPWVYSDFSLSQGYQPSPSVPTFLTGYSRRRTHARVLIKAMGTKRAPGKILAIIEDAANIGASEFWNSPGEFFFTLPAIHPQVAVIEPWQVHYALEHYRGQGWTEIAAGLITDYDATDNEVVFYGIDYLGLLSMSYDSRFNPDNNADQTTDKGGAKYVGKTIRQIIVDQLGLAKAEVNGLTGFISLGQVDAMNEKADIFATFKQRLTFIGGLIESHRAGTGKRTRLMTRKDLAGAWFWDIIDNPGYDRDNLRFEYGGLVQGFRVIPFGNWGTKLYGIAGRLTMAAKPAYIKVNAPGVDEARYGVVPHVNLWPDLADANDLKRRAQQMVRAFAKAGKQVALGIRVGSLSVKDGWDITDSILVSIKRGVVDTTRFGSGYWTIWGWSWHLYPDGHDELTLSILPREDDQALSPDLIPAAPIHNTPEWAIGKGPPGATTFAMVAMRSYVDGDTGKVYDYNLEDAVWVENVDANLIGPAGPPGPPGPPGGGLVQVGRWRWDQVFPPPPGNSRFGVQTQPPVAAGANQLLIHENDYDSADRSPYLDNIRAGDKIVIDDGAGHVWEHTVTGPVVDLGVTRQIPITYDDRAGTGALPLEPAEVVCQVSDLRGDTGDIVPPADPSGLVLYTGVRLQTDGTLRPYLQGSWSDPVDADFDTFGVYIAQASLYRPVQAGALGWQLIARTAAGTLPAGGYIVAVTAYGADGGESLAFTAQREITAGQQLVVTNLLASIPPEATALAHSFAIYVGVQGQAPTWYADTLADEVVIGSLPAAGGRTVPANSSAYAWDALTTVQLRVRLAQFMLEDVLGGWMYTARVRSIDTSGNRSGFLTPAQIVTASDQIAPETPTGLGVTPGYSLVGLRWDRSLASDLDRYQVRYRAVGDLDWSPVQDIYANFAIITDLALWKVEPTPAAPGIPASYEAQVRSIDRSGNVEITAGPPQAVGNASDESIGWCDPVSATLSPIPADAIAVEELFANWAYLINLSADQIITGHLNLTPDPSEDSAIIIWNDAAQTVMAGYWSPSGWYLIDPANRNKAIRGKNGAISFSNTAWFPTNPLGNGQVWQTPEAAWTTALSAAGINADLITTGGLPGGHNRLLNSGFELHPRAVASVIDWNTAAEWDAMVGAATNKTAGQVAYTQTKYRYTDV